MRLADYLLRREGRMVRLPIAVKCADEPAPRYFLLRRAMSFSVRYVTCSTDSKG